MIRSLQLLKTKAHFFILACILLLLGTPLLAQIAPGGVSGGGGGGNGLYRIDYSWTTATVNTCADMLTTTQGATTIVPNFAASGVTNFGHVFLGYIDIPVAGNYNFELCSDDGTLLYIDGVLEINNDGSHANICDSNIVNFATAGFYPIRLEFFQGAGPFAMSLRWDPTGGTTFTAIPNSSLIPGAGGDAFWFDAGTTVTCAAGRVATWTDRTTSAHLGTPVTAGEGPICGTTTLNGEPTVAYNPSAIPIAGGIDVPGSIDINTQSVGYAAKTYSFAFKTGVDVTNRQFIWEEGAGSNGLNIYVEAGQVHACVYQGGATIPADINCGSAAVAANTPYLITFEYDGAGGNVSWSLNGTQFLTSPAGFAVLPPHGGEIGLGEVNNVSIIPGPISVAANEEFRGEIAEAVGYNIPLTAVQRQQVESYMAIKYGLHLGHHYRSSANAIIWNATTAVAYHNSVFGYGRDDASGLNKSTSFSEHPGAIGSVITLSGTPTTDGSFMVCGVSNNSAAINFNQPFLGQVNSRMNKTWFVTETGDVDNQSIVLDGSVTFPTTGTRVIIISTDATFDATDLTIPLIFNGTDYTASVDLGTAQGAYFTFGTILAPGGIANDGTNEEFRLWLKASDLGLANNAVVTGWPDASGYKSDLTSAAFWADPDFRTNTANFNPSVDFDNSDYLERVGGVLGNGTNYTSANVFVVANTDGGDNGILEESIPGGANQFAIKLTTGGGDVEWESHDDKKIRDAIGGVPSGVGLYSFHAHPSTSASLNPNTGRRRTIYQNGTELKDDNETLSFVGDGSDFRLGWARNQYHDGDICEVIIHRGPMPAAKQQKIHSYLAIKHGITLSHDYVSTNDVVVWDYSANAPHNFDIAGIGIDGKTTLNQPVSQSINPGSVLEVTGTPVEGEFFVWGHTDDALGPLTATDAPSGMLRSDRVWKVQSTNYGSKTVTLVFDASSIMAGGQTPDYNLLINSTTSFQNGSVTYAAIADYTAQTITVADVEISDGNYFTIAEVDNPPIVDFVNNDIGSPTTWEACAGSDVSFFYDQFTAEPAEIRLQTKTGPQVFSVTPIPNNPGNGLFGGEVNIVLPLDIVTGQITFLDALGNPIYTPTPLLVVDNPDIGFAITQNPICVESRVELVGSPSGGVFSTVAPYLGALTGDTLIASYVPFTPNANDIVVPVPLTYTYTPSYVDGTPCPNTLTISKNADVRDNRLVSLEFKRVITANKIIPPGDYVVLDTMIDAMSPASIPFPLEFSGTYILFSPFSTISPPNEYRYLHSSSGFGQFPVIVEYDNGGCIGEITEYLDIFPPIAIPGLGDTICREAGLQVFTRDSVYRDTTISSTGNNPNGTTAFTRTVRQNEIDLAVGVSGITTVNSAHQVAITATSTTVNNESYNFNPALIPLTDSVVIVRMNFKNTTTSDNYDNLGNYIGTNVSTNTFFAEQVIVLTGRPTVDLDTIVSYRQYFCENNPQIHLVSSPAYESPLTTRYWTQHLGSFSVDSLPSDTILDITALYNSYDPGQNNDQAFDLFYEIDKYGCQDYDTTRFTIVQPVKPLFIGSNSGSGNVYCLLDPEDLLTASPPPNSGNGGVFTGAGMGLNNNGAPSAFARMFSPYQAGVNTFTGGPGVHPINYTYEDQYGCISQFNDTFTVRPEPNIEMATDDGLSEYCADVLGVGLHLNSLNGDTAVSVTFGGAGVVPGPTDTLFNPQQVFGGNSGSTFITSNFSDPYGCPGQDTLFIDIRPVPVLGITGLSASYCANDSTVIVTGSPIHSSGLGGFGGFFYGGGIFFQDTNFRYSPILAGEGPDTVLYDYANVFGCRNTLETILNIDTVPDTEIQGVPLQMCFDELPIQTNGIPDTNSLGTGFYGGIGMNANTGIFNPQAAGTGIRVLSFTFQDNNSCQSTAYDTVNVAPLPTINFVGLAPTYCTDYGADTLSIDSLVVPPGWGYFTGGAVTDSLLGYIDTQADTTGLRSITLVYTDSLYGCTNTLTKGFLINPLPTVSLAGLNAAYCSNVDKIDVTGFPAGVAGSFLIPDTTIFPVGVTATPGFNIAEFSPRATAAAGVDSVSLYYSFTDNNQCSNIDSFLIRVFSPSVSPSIAVAPAAGGLKSRYCATPDTVFVNAVPLGGDFVSLLIASGQDYFIPSSVGGGNYPIIYSSSETFFFGSDSLVCTDYDTATTEILVLPTPDPDMASNTQFCTTDSDTLLTGTISAGGNSIPDSMYFQGFGVYMDTTVTIDLSVPSVTIDTVYYFSPNAAGPGTHPITYVVRNQFGCIDSLDFTAIVSTLPASAPTTFTPSYCLRDNPVLLSTGGGFYMLGQDTVTAVYDPDHPVYGTTPTPRVDTLVYVAENGACVLYDSQYVQVNPNPDGSFVAIGHPDTSIQYPDFKFCMGMDTAFLQPATPGGSFYGDGTKAGTNFFIPVLAGTGSKWIHYTVTDPATLCETTFDTLFQIFNQPIPDFEGIGGCVDDSIQFVPNNDTLGLFTFNHEVDSISAIHWTFGDGVDSLAPESGINQAGVVLHKYNAPGVYNVVYEVENQSSCTAGDTFRIVISPNYDVYENAPYDQTFEADEGEWFAEGSGDPNGSIWSWGSPVFKDTIDANSVSVPGGASIWAVNMDYPYYPVNHNSWVYSPCFDIDSLNRPMISLDYWVQTVQGGDGAVLEYFDEDENKWRALGAQNRGINWYNTEFLLGAPGNQTIYVDANNQLVTPTGWSGNSRGWANGRYKLDEFKSSNLRLRIAFGSSAINADSLGGDGFAFDNVWIGSRKRSVLLEHFAHSDYIDYNYAGAPTMETINDRLYFNVFNQSLYEDVVHIQYNAEFPEFPGFTNDQYGKDNTPDPSTRKLYYGVTEPGAAIIDGDDLGRVMDMDFHWFEANMLAAEKFKIDITQFSIFGNQVIITADVEAMEDLPSSEYSVYVAIVQDNLVYTEAPLVGHETYGVLRKILPDASGTRFQQAWAMNDVVNIAQIWDANPGNFTNFNSLNLEAVVFIQDMNTKVVHQVATSRDPVSLYTGVTEAEVKDEVEEVNSMNLYPNPTENQFTVEFEAPLSQSYEWRLVDLLGQTIREGELLEGLTQLSVSGLELPSSTYIFVAGNDKFTVQRRVIITND